MKPLYFFLLLLLPVYTYAQSNGSDDTIIHITDSLYNKGIDTNTGYQHIYDSVEYAMTARWLKEDIETTGFRWPCRVDARKEEWTPTYRYLLLHKYSIDPSCISSGCVDQHYFRLYDSLMNDIIVAKLGKDFFGKSVAEAAAMDKNGAGLTMPYLRDSAREMKKMIKKLSFLYDISFDDGEYCPEYVIIHFKAGRVAEAYAGMSFLGWIQMDIHYGGWSDEVTRIVSEAKWQGPLFNHLPADKEIVLNLETRQLSFQ